MESYSDWTERKCHRRLVPSASGLEELDGVTKAVPFDVSLAANTRGELPIANKAATATIKARR